MEFLLPLLAFVLVSTITPGPNNFLLATSGIKFGVRASLRHVFGIHCGIYLLVVLWPDTADIPPGVNWFEGVRYGLPDLFGLENHWLSAWRKPYGECR